MAKLTETVQSGDWKAEKHVPVIHIDKKDDGFKVCAIVGEEIEHPNTFEHHIAWIKVFFQPEGETSGRVWRRLLPGIWQDLSCAAAVVARRYDLRRVVVACLRRGILRVRLSPLSAPT